jgi:hypothetical protein
MDETKFKARGFVRILVRAPFTPHIVQESACSNPPRSPNPRQNGNPKRGCKGQ